jgi:hypothetical protein
MKNFSKSTLYHHDNINATIQRSIRNSRFYIRINRLHANCQQALEDHRYSQSQMRNSIHAQASIPAINNFITEIGAGASRKIHPEINVEILPPETFRLMVEDLQRNEIELANKATDSPREQVINNHNVISVP